MPEEKSIPMQRSGYRELRPKVHRKLKDLLKIEGLFFLINFNSGGEVHSDEA